MAMSSSVMLNGSPFTFALHLALASKYLATCCLRYCLSQSFLLSATGLVAAIGQ